MQQLLPRVSNIILITIDTDRDSRKFPFLQEKALNTRTGQGAGILLGRAAPSKRWVTKLGNLINEWLNHAGLMASSISAKKDIEQKS
jgi:hypothetical protein